MKRVAKIRLQGNQFPNLYFPTDYTSYPLKSRRMESTLTPGVRARVNTSSSSVAPFAPSLSLSDARLFCRSQAANLSALSAGDGGGVAWPGAASSSPAKQQRGPSGCFFSAQTAT